MILNATGAIYYFYTMLFAAAFFVLFYGIVVLYKAIHHKDDEGIRNAKFIMLLAVIAVVGITIVSFFITGTIPLN
ncbi:hypothetical protein [Hydrotalea sp.]|uniref:hypothetical protein n=1 Tax=Hydrotalea sp. TaxID=2881279 RepID=UPI0026128299|nr:hypothetical protein [Hydrotalea sp.]